MINVKRLFAPTQLKTLPSPVQRVWSVKTVASKYKECELQKRN